ncbi:MAG: hypothetical protein JWP49_1613 [Phenylobacterium sp.]|jgi:hypothetical protein|nr:hypothetical protein [Phenylobacterium sp.]
MAAQACGGLRWSAPDGALALLTAVQAGDDKGFEAVVDRPALRADLRVQIARLAHASGLDVGGPSDPALDRMIGRQVFHLADPAGAPLAKPVTKAQVELLVKPVDKTRACLRDLTPQQRCLLTFTQETGGWRLTGMPAGEVVIQVPPDPTKK